ncbi:MAG: hypothetical protein AAF605_07885 [Myxococcota bacterium]
MAITRRDALLAGLFGGGALGLRSLVSGLPPGLLIDPLLPRVAHASSGFLARTLIVSSSSEGDPINGNVPGTYGPGLEDVKHPADPRLAETAFEHNGAPAVAAKPWAELPTSILDRMSFFHHATYTNSHPNHSKSMRLQGAVRNNEMLFSALAAETAPALMTTQTEPVSLGADGGELISFRGRKLSNVSPTGLSAALSQGSDAELARLRDDTVDELYDLYRERGTKKHIALLDTFARTRREAREVNASLLDRLGDIDNQDRVTAQITAASVLTAMNLAPVITIEIPFGRDNHADPGLYQEITETLSGVDYLERLLSEIAGLQAEGVIRQEVVFATMNVFGRTLSLKRKGLNGRDHNAQHHCMIIHGDGVRGGTIGGLEQKGGDWAAAPIDSSTGVASQSGDVPFAETYQAAAKTLGAAIGVGETQLDDMIDGGRIVRAALQ